MAGSVTALLCAWLLFAPLPAAAEAVATEQHRVQVVTLVEGLEHPWSLAFLPQGDVLITERPGRLRLVRDGRLLAEPVAGVPPVAAVNQGGLLDVVLHPAFADNRVIYLSYAAGSGSLFSTEVARARLDGMQLNDVEVIFRAQPKSRGGRHFGSRLLFLPDGTLLITLGDRGDRPTGQDRTGHDGSIIRLRDDGSVPPDNPWPDSAGIEPSIYSYGHRNVQGIVRHPDSGHVWAHEHGPMGGDELNRVVAGTNYGWPVITYGVNYGIGTRIGEGTSKQGMEQPVHYWVPSIAASGLAYYDGDAFPRWRGNLFAGSLKFSELVRLELRDAEVVHEERLLKGQLGRVRDVRQGPDGLLYLLIDHGQGTLLRIEPAA